MDRSKAKEFVGSVLAIAIEPTYFDMERCRVDPEGIVATAVRCHANALRVGMKSHQGHAYYQSRIAPHAPGLGHRDLLNEFLAAGREAGVAIVTYMDSRWDTPRYAEHPEWAMQHDGEVRVHEAEADLHIHPMCFNSPYLDYFQSLLREVAGEYGPDGVYIDNFGVALNCDCQFCAAAFREASGQALPLAANWDDPVWQEFRHWSRERNFVLARRLVEAIRSASPEMPVVFNRGRFRSMTGHGNPEDLATFAHDIADNIHGESAVRFYGQDFAHINEQCMFGRAIETPMWTWVEYPLLPWSHVSAPPAEVKIKAAKVLANGGRPMVWNLPCAPDCDGRGLAGLAEVFGLAAQYPDYFNHTQHLPFIGVLYSSQTMEEYCRGDAAKYGECQKEFAGALALARHSHMPADILLDRHMTRERLSRYQALVLPNAAALSDRQCDEVRAFVEAGGGLVATYESSLCNERGGQREDFGLADVLGAKFDKQLRPQSARWSTGYSVIDRDHPLTRALGTGFRLPAGGRYLGVREADAAARLSTLLTRCRYYCDYPGQPTEFPGIIVNEYGKGRVLYVPGQFGLTYAERGFPDYRRLIYDAIDWMTRGQVPIRTSLPKTVEVTLARTAAGELVLHLVNCSADLSTPVERVVPVADETIQIQFTGSRPCRARALVANADLPCQVRDGLLHVELPMLGEYEVIAIG